MLLIDPDGNYPRFKGDVKIAVKGWDETQPLPEGWAEVTPTDLPVAMVSEAIEELFPQKIDGKYYQAFKVRPKTEQEIANQERLRAKLEEQRQLGLI